MRNICCYCRFYQLSIINYSVSLGLGGTKNFSIRLFYIWEGEIRKGQKREAEELLKTGPTTHYLIVIMPCINLDMNYHKYIHT